MGHHIFYLAVHFLMSQAFFLSLSYYRVCNRMRKMLFQTGSQTQHAVSVFSSKGDYICHCRLSLRKGSGLIKDHRLCLSYSL